MSSTVLDRAIGYRTRGWRPIPVPFRKKAPIVTGWQKFELSKAELSKHFIPPCNVGVLLGDGSGGLIDVDLDHPLAVTLADQHLPPTDSEFGRTSKTRSHRLYVVDQAPRTKKHLVPAGADSDGGGMIVELRSNGCQTVFPGSTHECGEPIEWSNDGEPAKIAPNELLASVKSLAAAVISKLSCAADSTQSTQEAQETHEITCAPCVSVCSALSVSNDVEKVIFAKTLPCGEHQRHRCLFDLARELRALPELAAAEWPILEPIIRRWHKLALPVIGTQPFEDSWFEFQDAWERVKFPAGAGPIDEALAAAALNVPAAAAAYEQPALKLLVAWCRELQRIEGGEFFLSCRLAGEKLGVDHSTVALWLRALCRHGVLVEVSKGTKATRRASTYRYVPND